MTDIRDQNIILIMDITGKDSSMIINIWIKERANIKVILLIIYRAINIQIDRKEVGAEVEVGKEAIVDIGLKGNIHTRILFINLMIMMINGEWDLFSLFYFLFLLARAL